MKNKIASKFRCKDERILTMMIAGKKRRFLLKKGIVTFVVTMLTFIALFWFAEIISSKQINDEININEGSQLSKLIE